MPASAGTERERGREGERKRPSGRTQLVKPSGRTQPVEPSGRTQPVKSNGPARRIRMAGPGQVAPAPSAPPVSEPPAAIIAGVRSLLSESSIRTRSMTRITDKDVGEHRTAGIRVIES